MARFRNTDWSVETVEGKPGSIRTWDGVKISVLMDIRDELQKLNALLHCSNFTQIPARLRRISRNTYVAKNGTEPKNGHR